MEDVKQDTPSMTVKASTRKVVKKADKKRGPAAGAGSGLGLAFETRQWYKGGVVVGVDEAGRGPLAGPVVAAAYRMKGPGCPVPPQVQDSKVMTHEEREEAFAALTAGAPEHAEYALAVAEAGVIDNINILQATYAAMTAAVAALPPTSADHTHVAVDGNRMPPGIALMTETGTAVGGLKRPRPSHSAEAVVKGDSKVHSIAAASVLAKVARDRLMVRYDEEYPVYNLAQHKGYPTSAHMSAVRAEGPSPIHRLTFAPLRGNFSAADVHGSAISLPLEVIGDADVQARIVVVPADTQPVQSNKSVKKPSAKKRRKR